MKLKKRNLLILLLMAILTVHLVGTGVFADVKAYTTVPEAVVPTVRGICNTANYNINKTILECTTEGRLSFDNDEYIKLSQKDKTKFMEDALSATRSSGLGIKVKNQVYNFISQQDTTISATIKYLSEDTAADFASAMKYIRPFSSPISTAMAILCIIIFMFIGMGVLIDVAYLALPLFRIFLERGDTTKKPWGISTAAYSAVQIVEGDTKMGKGLMPIYIQKRVPEIFIIAVCLGYLISGKIWDILAYLASSF